MTKKMIVELEDAQDTRFRKAISDSKGLHKGVIKQAVEEAIEMWIQEQLKTPAQKAKVK